MNAELMYVSPNTMNQLLLQIDETEDFLEGIVENNKLLDLLHGFGLATAFNALSSCGFTFEKIKYINNDDLDVVFPGREHTALKAELREKINKWRTTNFPSEIPACNCQSKVLHWVQNENLSRENTPFSDKTNYSFNPRVIDILKSTKAGEDLLKVYSNKKKLGKQDRKKLLNCLVEYFFEPNINRYKIPSPRQQEKLADQIVEIFPTETKDIYFISRKKGVRANPSGLLFNRLNNINRKRKNLDDAPQKIEAEEEESAVPSCEKTPHTTSMNKKIKLMHKDEPEALE